MVIAGQNLVRQGKALLAELLDQANLCLSCTAITVAREAVPMSRVWLLKNK